MKIKTFLFLALAFFALGNIQAQEGANIEKQNIEQPAKNGVENVAAKSSPEAIAKPKADPPLSSDSLDTWIAQVKSWFLEGGNPIDTPDEFNGRVYVVDMILTLILGFISLLIPGINRIPKQRYRMLAIVLVLVGSFSYGLNLSLVQILGLLGSSGLAMFVYKEWIAPLIKSEDISNLILKLFSKTTEAA